MKILIITFVGGILIAIIFMLLFFISKMKKELRKINVAIQEEEYIYVINILDKDIENLVTSINNRISLEEEKEYKLRTQDKNFKKMVANLSHDLRTPLTVIIGYLQLIQMDNQIPKQILEYVECIEKKSEYLKRLVDDLYMFFLNEALDEKIKLQKIDLLSVVTSILKEYIQNSKFASENMEIDLPKGQIWINGDEKILIRILCNILDNALKYSLGMISFRIYVKGEKCYIIVENPSSYINEEEIKLIFELFYTKEQARLTSSGIGLYSTKKMVEQLYGKIDAKYYEEKFQISVEIPLREE